MKCNYAAQKIMIIWFLSKRKIMQANSLIKLRSTLGNFVSDRSMDADIEFHQSKITESTIGKNKFWVFLFSLVGYTSPRLRWGRVLFMVMFKKKTVLIVLLTCFLSGQIIHVIFICPSNENFNRGKIRTYYF